jgi:hypothetical protein
MRVSVRDTRAMSCAVCRTMCFLSSMCICTVYFAVFSAGCEMYQNDCIVTVRLPAPPSDWPEAVQIEGWRVRWIDGDGSQQHTLVSGTRRRVQVSIPKQYGIPVVAEPALTAAGAHLPVPAAGAVWPVQGSSDKTLLRVSWKHGFLAELVWVLHAEGNSAAVFNLDRLAAECIERSGGNPRDLDMRSLAEAILARSFRVTLIRPAEYHTFRLDTGETWVSLTPGAPGLRPGPDNAIEARLVEGVHTFIRADGSALLSVQVDGNGNYRAHILDLPLTSQQSLPAYPGQR